VKIVMMVTADYAAAEPPLNKLNVLGVFNRIVSSEFPLLYRRMYLAVNFEGEISDSAGPYDVSISIAGEDGQVLIAIEGQLDMPDSSPGVAPQHCIVAELNQLVFPVPGDYRIYVSVSDVELDESTVLRVVQAVS